MIEIINVLGIAWLVTNYSAFWWHIKAVVSKPKVVLDIPFKILNCLMCSSFWVGLIFTRGDIPLCGFISLIAFCIDKYLISTPIKL